MEGILNLENKTELNTVGTRHGHKIFQTVEERTTQPSVSTLSRQIDFGCVCKRGRKQTACERWVLELDLDKVISELSRISTTSYFCTVGFQKMDFYRCSDGGGKHSTFTFFQAGL